MRFRDYPTCSLCKAAGWFFFNRFSSLSTLYTATLYDGLGDQGSALVMNVEMNQALALEAEQAAVVSSERKGEGTRKKNAGGGGGGKKKSGTGKKK